ncbi:MAG: FAD-linked oxidoreductase [Actinomycetia bacterium]|nr:FAD-linked oxidoreductase [Actinomycetes bacterium]
MGRPTEASREEISGYGFAFADLAEVARWTDEIAAVLPSSVELSVVLGTAGPDLTTAAPGTAVVTVTATAFAGSRDEAARSLEPAAPLRCAGDRVGVAVAVGRGWVS